MSDALLTVDEVIDMMEGQSYEWGQVHHTYKPNHDDFTGDNYQPLQDGMRNYHVNTRGWSDIGQHLTIFPDGMCMLGRDFDLTPVGIAGYNTGSFMVEHVGDFDKGHDSLVGDQLDASLKIYNYLVNHCGAEILFHREKSNKTCPGTGVDKFKFVKAVNDYNADDTLNVTTDKAEPYTQDAKWPKKENYGANVLKLQKLLNKAGYNVAEDKSFGPATDQAIRQFQKDHGLVVDGQAGPNTQEALKNAKGGNDIAEDGWLGNATAEKAQRVYDLDIVDGIVSGQPKNASTLNIPAAVFGSGGSNLIEAMQVEFGTIQDRIITNPSELVGAMQIHYGTIHDKKISGPSNVIKAWQHALNQGKRK